MLTAPYFDVRVEEDPERSVHEFASMLSALQQLDLRADIRLIAMLLQPNNVQLAFDDQPSDTQPYFSLPHAQVHVADQIAPQLIALASKIDDAICSLPPFQQHTGAETCSAQSLLHIACVLARECQVQIVNACNNLCSVTEQNAVMMAISTSIIERAFFTILQQHFSELLKVAENEPQRKDFIANVDAVTQMIGNIQQSIYYHSDGCEQNEETRCRSVVGAYLAIVSNTSKQLIKAMDFACYSTYVRLFKDDPREISRNIETDQCTQQVQACMIDMLPRYFRGHVALTSPSLTRNHVSRHAFRTEEMINCNCSQPQAGGQPCLTPNSLLPVSRYLGPEHPLTVMSEQLCTISSDVRAYAVRTFERLFSSATMHIPIRFAQLQDLTRGESKKAHTLIDAAITASSASYPRLFFVFTMQEVDELGIQMKVCPLSATERKYLQDAEFPLPEGELFRYDIRHGDDDFGPGDSPYDAAPNDSLVKTAA